MMAQGGRPAEQNDGFGYAARPCLAHGKPAIETGERGLHIRRRPLPGSGAILPQNPAIQWARRLYTGQRKAVGRMAVGAGERDLLFLWPLPFRGASFQ